MGERSGADEIHVVPEVREMLMGEVNEARGMVDGLIGLLKGKMGTRRFESHYKERGGRGNINLGNSGSGHVVVDEESGTIKVTKLLHNDPWNPSLKQATWTITNDGIESDFVIDEGDPDRCFQSSVEFGLGRDITIDDFNETRRRVACLKQVIGDVVTNEFFK